MCAGSANTGSGFPAPNGPAREIVVHSSAPAAAAVSAPSMRSALSRRAASTAALGEEPIDDGTAHRAAEIDAGNRAAGAGADAGRIECDGERRTAEFLLQA